MSHACSTLTAFVRALRATAPILLAAALPARADRIMLKNGHTIEGRVERETPAAVTLRLATGTVDFRRSQIDSILRDSADRNAVIEAGWREKHLLDRPNVPAGFEALAASFVALEDQRRLATEAQRMLEQGNGPAGGAERKLAALREDYVAVSKQLQTASPSNNIDGYNALVASNNALHAAIAMQLTEIDREGETRATRMRAISDYLAALQDAAKAVTTARNSLADATTPDPAAASFVEKLIVRLKTCEGDFKPLDANARLQGNATLVTALVNGRTWGQFVVDTGAEIATLSRDFAERAGIPLEHGESVSLRLADGSPVAGRLVRLASVRIGDVDQAQIEAAILPYPPGPELDGLLGMNVLRAFHISMDRNTGLLKLDRFDPR